MNIKRSIFLCAFLLSVTACVVGQSVTGPVDFQLKDINGRTLSTAEYRGKVLLVNFWATWCVPCRVETPDLIRWQRQYWRQDLRILGLTYPPSNISEVREYVRKLKVNYRVALGSKEIKTNLTSSEALPVTVVIDRDGTIRDVIEGIIYPDEFEQKVKPLLTSHPKRWQLPKSSLAPIQKATIRVDSHGYRPASIRLRRGLPVRPRRSDSPPPTINELCVSSACSAALWHYR
jgi:thiol-disulfide isomerase/thioredoxin